ncbi:hypothetical protein IQ07DRAFT_226254 [Pyrenochaeta sp. DS3sAY3a]|nr:hypothetical protein IQ07DRAFT_226254 [Pyrenochaeta sp. DS3sAY3a]
MALPFEETFLGGQAASRQRGGAGGSMTINAHDHARVIGNIEYNGPVHQHYSSSQAPGSSRILTWLWASSSDPADPITAKNRGQNDSLKAAISRLRGQTESWFLQSPDFKSWYTSGGSSLWLWGKIGCGKTVQFSAIVQHLQRTKRRQKGLRVGHYYCRAQAAVGDEKTMIIRRWLAQICILDDDMSSVQDLYDECHESYPPREPDAGELEDVLMAVLQAYSTPRRPEEAIRIILLIDALDELPGSGGQRADILCMLRRLALKRWPHVSILATSRDRADIQGYLQPSFQDISMDYDKVDADIRRYVPRAIEDSPPLQRQAPDIKMEIVNRLVGEAKGTFRWAALQILLLQSLEVVSSNTLRQALLDLPPDLHSTYLRIFDRWNPILRRKALSALQWIIVATRPLFIEELVEACAFRVEATPNLESDSSRLQPYNLFELLQELVIIEPHLKIDQAAEQFSHKRHTVVLAHISVAEFCLPYEHTTNLPHQFQFSLVEGNRIVAKACLAYLFQFNKRDQTQTRSLLEYAWYHWEEHVSAFHSRKEKQGRVRNYAMELFACLSTLAVTAGVHSDLGPLQELLDWLSLEDLKVLLRAIRHPQFVSNIDKFYAENHRNKYPRMRSFEPLHTPRTVRLVHLLPSLDYNTPIRGRLETISLDENPKYDAISYTWGSPDKMDSVIIEDGVVLITANLMSVLRTLCAQRQGQTPSLWVDAICIDQRNSLERNHQVGLIGDIFSGAQEVLLCIGPGNDHDDEAIAGLRTLSANCSGEMNETESIEEHQVHNIYMLLDSEFWGRLWILQEVVLAQRATVLRGHSTFPLSLLEDLYRQIYKSEAPHQILFLYELKFAPVARTILTRIEHNAGHEMDLSTLLCRFEHHKCSDPRDRVYALLGLLREHSIVIDYTQSFVQTFARVARYLIERENNFNVLSHARGYEYGRLSSWIPLYQASTHPFQHCSKADWTFCAGGQTNVDVCWEGEGPHIMCPRGRIIATIANLLDGALVDLASRLNPTLETGRRYFSSTDGTPGLGPEHLRIGDTVAIFAGAPVPFILRLHCDYGREGWVVIGECYVEGFMHGEGADHEDWTRFVIF